MDYVNHIVLTQDTKSFGFNGWTSRYEIHVIERRITSSPLYQLLHQGRANLVVFNCISLAFFFLMKLQIRSQNHKVDELEIYKVKLISGQWNVWRTRGWAGSDVDHPCNQQGHRVHLQKCLLRPVPRRQRYRILATSSRVSVSESSVQRHPI